jgi:hypothetical protein
MKRTSFKKYSFILLIVILALAGCGKTETVDNDPAISASTVAKTVFEVVDEPLIYSETIEYGEVYNENGLAINIKEYVHTQDECYVLFEFVNNSDNELKIYEDCYSVNDRMSIPREEMYGIDKNKCLNVTLSPRATETKKLDLMPKLSGIALNDLNVKRINLLLYVYEETTSHGFYPYIQINTSIDDGGVKFIYYPIVYEDEELRIEYVGRTYDSLLFNIFNKSDTIKQYTLDRIKVDEKTAYVNREYSTDCYQEFVFPNCKGDLFILFYNETDTEKIKDIEMTFDVKTTSFADEPYTKDGIKIEIAD